MDEKLRQYHREEIKRLDTEITNIQKRIDEAVQDYLRNKPKCDTKVKQVTNEKILQSRIIPLKSMIRKKQSRQRILNKKVKE